jgi:GNAT superfamily N-acetyltransferase
MQATISKDIIQKWLTGWSVSRGLPIPSAFRSGFKADVGFEKQKCRYVFPVLNDDFFELAKTVVEPWTFLKVCAPADKLVNLLPPRWVIQPQGYMMHCFHPMKKRALSLNKEFELDLEENGVTYYLQIRDIQGALAASGRVVLIEEIAIYDRISTELEYRRRGLATLLLFELERIALSKGVRKNVLVATEEGRGLYTSLGWDLYSHYTSFVIPLIDSVGSDKLNYS